MWLKSYIYLNFSSTAIKVKYSCVLYLFFIKVSCDFMEGYWISTTFIQVFCRISFLRMHISWWKNWKFYFWKEIILFCVFWVANLIMGRIYPIVKRIPVYLKDMVWFQGYPLHKKLNVFFLICSQRPHFFLACASSGC